MRKLQITVAFAMIVLLAGAIFAVPEMMNIQGVLTDAAGNPVADGDYGVTFRIYDAESGGSEVWSEAIDDVYVGDGLFSVLIGSINPLTANVVDDDNRWLGIQLDGESEMMPRSRITSVGYALHAAKADTAEVALSGGESPWVEVPGGIAFPDGCVGVFTDNPRERFQIGDQIAIHDGGLKCLGFNWYWDNPGETDRHLIDGPAARMAFGSDGMMFFQVAAPGNANEPVQWKSALNLHNGGDVSTNDAITAHGPLVTDLRGRSGSAGRDALHIWASDDNSAGVIVVNKPDLLAWSRSENRKANVLCQSLYANDRVSCGVLEITGGADLAEPFPISRGHILEPGSVVIIDEDNPGMVTLGDQPYDHRVAGVISGAEDIQPGIILTARGRLDDGQRVALTGRVKVFATADNGSIKPGDLLTTSSVPGHAMKATDPDRWPGAVIGKAMTPLTDGTGYVLALVNLQ